MNAAIHTLHIACFEPQFNVHLVMPSQAHVLDSATGLVFVLPALSFSSLCLSRHRSRQLSLLAHRTPFSNERTPPFCQGLLKTHSFLSPRWDHHNLRAGVEGVPVDAVHTRKELGRKTTCSCMARKHSPPLGW